MYPVKSFSKGQQNWSSALLNHRYRIIQTLSSDDLRVVYLAYDLLAQGELRVLEEITPDAFSQLPGFRDRVDLVGQMVSVINQTRHPSLPIILEAFTDNSSIFLVRAYIPGTTLKEYPDSVSETKILSWLRSLLEALANLHKRGIYHDNIAPENIVIHQQTQLPVLINFNSLEGIASTDEALPSDRQAIRDLAAANDLYALAVLAISLLTEDNFHDLMRTQNWVAHWQDYCTVTAELANMLNTMLSFNPRRQFKSADDFLAALPNPYTHGKTLENSKSSTITFHNWEKGIIGLLVLSILLTLLMMSFDKTTVSQLLFPKFSNQEQVK